MFMQYIGNLPVNVNQHISAVRSWRMGDEGTDDSSDDSFSYKNTAKRALEAAKKKIAAAPIPSATIAVIDFSSDSDGNNRCRSEALPITAKTSAPSKRKGVSHSTVGKRKRLRRKRGASSIVRAVGNKPPIEDVHDVYSTDNSVEDSRELYTAISPVGLTSKPGINVEIETCDILDSDVSDGNAEGVVGRSDSSELEIVSPSSPGIVVSKGEETNDENELMSIKISWKLEPIQKFQLRRHQKFKVLMEHFAKLEGVPLQKIVIYGGKNNCRLLEPCDTPDTIGVTVTDVLEGGVLVEGSEVRGQQRSRGLAGQCGDGITVRVQMEGVRSFPVMIGHHQKMQVLLVKVAEQMEVAIDKVKLSLDGEIISSVSTPEQLELEEGDVLDVHLL